MTLAAGRGCLTPAGPLVPLLCTTRFSGGGFRAGASTPVALLLFVRDGDPLLYPLSPDAGDLLGRAPDRVRAALVAEARRLVTRGGAPRSA
ncbi:MAG: hypothetical protein ACP5C4_08390 [Methanomicrobiales archaeon]